MIDELRKFGLTFKEARVYLATLNLGEESPVSTIARKAGIHRTTTYDILESLEKKGLVVRHEKKKHQYYRAHPPTYLINHLKEQSYLYQNLAEQAKEILPELTCEYKGISGRPRVYFYEGEEGLVRVYEETLNSTEDILAYASAETNLESIPWYFPEYYKRRAERGIHIRAIFADSEADRERHSLDKEEYRTSYVLPKEIFDFTPEINVFDDKIMIAHLEEKLGIIIESKEIAKAFKQVFELAWESAEKHHKKLMGDPDESGS